MNPSFHEAVKRVIEPIPGEALGLSVSEAAAVSIAIGLKRVADALCRPEGSDRGDVLHWLEHCARGLNSRR